MSKEVRSIYQNTLDFSYAADNDGMMILADALRDAADEIRRLEYACDETRSVTLEEAAKAIDSQAALYRGYSERALSSGDGRKSSEMWDHYLTLCEAANTIRALAGAGKAPAPQASAERDSA